MAVEQKIGPVFVVGAPRTGTTLTMEILNRHPLVHLFDEVHYNERVVDQIGNPPTLTKQQIQHAVDILKQFCPRFWETSVGEQARAGLLEKVETSDVTHGMVFSEFLSRQARHFDKEIWGDSSPQDVLYMGMLKEWYPDARFVGLVRDPRAYLASYKNYYKKEISNYRNRFNPMSNSLLWRSYMNALLDAKNGSLSESLILLKYEDLVSDPETEVSRISDFLGLDFHAEMLNVRRQNSSYINVEEDRKKTGISSGSLGRWREELSSSELWILNKICGKTMVKLGYELEGHHLGLGDLPDMLRMTAVLPSRMFNILFRTGKPFTLEKLRRVFKSFR